MNGIDLSLGLRLGLRTSAPPGPSFDFFIAADAAGGGDGSYADPWFPSEVTGLSTGARLGIKAGSVFDADTLDLRIASSVSELSFGVYGDGDRPIFRNRKTITGDWTNVATNIWQKTVTQVSNAKASGNIFYDGQPGILVQNRAALTSAAALGRFYVAAWGWAGGISATTSLVIETYSTVQPNGDGHTYEFPPYLNAFDLTGNDITLEDIIAEGGLHQDGVIRLPGDRNTVRRCDIGHGSRHGLLTGQDFLIEDCLYYGGRNRQEASGSFDAMVCNKGTFGAGALGTIRRTTHTPGSYIVSGDNPLFYYDHDGGSGHIETLTVEDLTLNFGSCGFGLSSATLDIDGLTLTDAARLLGEGSGSKTVNITDASGTLGNILRTNHSSGTVTINTEGCDLDIDFSKSLLGDFTRAPILSLNTGLLQWNEQGDHISRLDTSGGSRCLSYIVNGGVTRYDTVIDTTGWSSADSMDRISPDSGAGVATFAGDRNTYPATRDKWKMLNVAYANLAAWRAATGQEAASVTA